MGNKRKRPFGFGKKSVKKFDGKRFNFVQGFSTKKQAEDWFKLSYDPRHRMYGKGDYYHRIVKGKSYITDKKGKRLSNYYLYIREKK